MYKLDRPVQLKKKEVVCLDDSDDDTNDGSDNTFLVVQPRGRPVFGPPRVENIDALRRQLAPHKEVHLITWQDILRAGLLYCGFGDKMQKRVNLERNVKRFKAHYGSPPTVVAPIMKDLRDDNPGIALKDVLMSMNWLYLYDTREVLCGRWGGNENDISKTAKSTTKKIQQLKHKKIVFEYPEDAVVIGSGDTCTFLMDEMRLDPSSKWYDPKSHSCGAVSYVTNSICYYSLILLLMD